MVFPINIPKFLRMSILKIIFWCIKLNFSPLRHTRFEMSNDNQLMLFELSLGKEYGIFSSVKDFTLTTSWILYQLLLKLTLTAQKMKFFIRDIFSKCDQIRRKLQIWSHLLEKSLKENFIFCAVSSTYDTHLIRTLQSWTYY